MRYDRGIVDWPRTVLTVAAVALTPGCALLDGLGGDGNGDCDTPSGSCDEGDTCQFTQFLGEPPIDEPDIDNCGRQNDFSLGFCDATATGDDIVFEFFVVNTGNYTICSSATPGSDFFVSSSCESPESIECLEVNGGCRDMFLESGMQFVFWKGGVPGDCSFIELQIFETGSGGGEVGAACLDGIDNDSDGREDCEDFDCVDEPRCDGFSDCNQTSAEGSCQCVDDQGCDDITPGFRCHPDTLAPGFGVCGPDCNFFDWCIDQPNLRCEQDGLCVNDATSPTGPGQ